MSAAPELDPTTATPPRVWHDPRQLRVLGMGSALPGPPIPTDELLGRIARRFGAPVTRRGRRFADKLGIETRHVCRDFESRREAPRPGHTNPDLAAQALLAALAEAGLRVDDLAYVIGHTTSPACLVPPNTALVAERLGYTGPYLELRQACTGFANALVVAQGLLAAPAAGPVAIVGSETGSVYFDPCRAGEDVAQLVNLVQMGDGAAAIVLAPDAPGSGARLSDVYFGHIGADRTPGFRLAAGGSDAPFADSAVLEFEHDFAAVRTSGPELFAQGAAAARHIGTPAEDADHVIPHQANGRLAELLGPFLGIDPERVFVHANRVGNVGSAAIWLALADLRGRAQPGERVLALGAEATKFMLGGFSYIHG